MQAARRTLWVFAALTGILLGGTLVANVLVDPTGDFGVGLFRTVVWNDRQEKVALLHALKSKPPKALILGSSRSMKIEPAYVTKKTGLPTFNAAVTSAMPEDYLALMSLVTEELRCPLRLVIVGVDVEAFHDAQPYSQRLLAEPDLRRHADLHWTGRLLARLSAVFEALSLDRLRSTLVVLRAAATRYPEQNSFFDPDGLLHYRKWEAEPRGKTDGSLDRLESSRTEYLRRFKGYHSPDAARIERLDRLLLICRQQGIRPLLFLTPLHPGVAKFLDAKTEYTRLRKNVAEIIKNRARQHGALFKDFSDIASFGGSPEDFYDGAHMSEVNTRRLIDQLLTP